MNYRHAFHAGNFADLVKHAALLDLLTKMQAQPGPLHVIDTHAGRGLYDLTGDEAQRSGEAEAGIGQLMKADDLPDAFQPLRTAVSELNEGGATRFYPGSPLLIANALRPGDSYLACELRPEEHGELKDALKGKAGVRTACADGFEAAVTRARSSGSLLILIDPPFEKSDDYRRIVTTLTGVVARNPEAVFLIWMPLKDLETFDAFLRDAEDSYSGSLLVAEARMRPLTDPMKMNGCALVLANAPADFAEPLTAICDWTVTRLGDKGQAKVWTAA